MADPTIRASLAGILLFAIGVAIGGGAVVNYQRERASLEGWQPAEGRVVELLTVGGKPRPVVGFTAATGDRIRFTASGPLANRAYNVGDAVQVLYPLERPASAQLESSAIRWARTVYAGAGSLVLILLGGYLANSARRRHFQQPG